MKPPLLHRVAAWELPLMALAALAGIASPRLLPLALASAVLLTGIRWAAVGRLFPRTPADWPVGLIAILVPVGLWAATGMTDAVPYALRLLLGMLLFYSTAHAAAEGRGLMVVMGFMAVGAALALVVPFADRLGVNANVLAGALLLPLAFPLARLLFTWGDLDLRARILAVASVALMLTALFLTRSRGAWIGLAALLLVLAVYRWRRGWLLAAAAAAAGTIAFAASGGRLLGAGLETRAEIWARALHMLQEFPFTGIGFGSFGRVTELLYPLFLVGSQTDLPHAHNLFLQVGLDLGLAGLVAWLAIYFLALAGSHRVWREGRNAQDAAAMALGAGLLAGQVGVGIHGLLDAVLWSSGPALLLWAAWGLAMGAWSRLNRGAGRSTRPAPDHVT
jgi:putative inorganic carbon (HCO3(-)) transporter